MAKEIIKENVIEVYSASDILEYYKKIGLWKAEKILIKKYFTKRKQKVLDIGCGGGRTTIPLAKMGYEVIAFDITPAMVKLTKENLKKNKAKANVDVGNVTKIEHPSNFFDYALFSFNGIEAIPGKKNRIKALKEIYRILKPGGVFIFTTNTKKYFQGKRKLFCLKESLKYYLSKYFNLKNKYSRIRDYEYGDSFLNFNPPMFLHFSTPERVKEKLEKIGFEILYSEFRDIIQKKSNPDLTKDFFYVCRKPQ